MASFELLGCGLRMVVHPVPDRHVDQGDAGNFIGGPEFVQCFFGLAFGVRSGQAEHFEVVTLEDHASASVKAVFGTPCSKV